MKYWIFTVTGHKTDGKNFTPEEIFNQRMREKMIPTSDNTTYTLQRHALVFRDIAFGDNCHHVREMRSPQNLLVIPSIDVRVRFG